MKCPACQSTRVKKLHNGVCFRCRDKFDKRHHAVCLEGKEEAPIAELDELPNHHARHSFEETGHFDEGGLVAVTMPEDFAALDSYLVKQPKSALALAAEILRELLLFCFQQRNSKQTNLKTAAARLGVIGSGLRAELFNDASLTILANELGYTKSALCKISTIFESRFKFKFSRSRTADGRAWMAAAQRGHPATNVGKQKSRQAVSTAAGDGQADGKEGAGKESF